MSRDSADGVSDYSGVAPREPNQSGIPTGPSYEAKSFSIQSQSQCDAPHLYAYQDAHVHDLCDGNEEEEGDAARALRRVDGRCGRGRVREHHVAQRA